MVSLTLGLLTAVTIPTPRALMAQEADRVWTGVIEQTPSQGRKFGVWTVSGKQFAANARTEFDALEGQLVPGTCVRVDYRINRFGGRIAEEIDSEPTYYCQNGNTDQKTGTSNSVAPVTSQSDNTAREHSGRHEEHDEEDRWLYARIDAMPSSGLIGEWTIGGVQYVTSRSTFFAQEEGRFRIGACVDVEYIEGNPRRATELKTESSYECR